MKLMCLCVTICTFFLPLALRAGEYHGLIEPHRIIKVGSGTEGVLATVDVDRGDAVRKGQVLGTLQSGVEKASAELARARAQMEGAIRGKEASKTLFQGKKTRIERLATKDFAAPSEMEEAEANMIVADMQLKEALENKRLAELEYQRSVEVVKRLTIESPVDGVIVERFLSPGEYIKDQPVVKLAQLDPLNVEIIMPASQLLSVRPGMSATVIPEAPLSGRYAAVVKIVDKVIDAASGTFGVRLELPNPGSRLPAGLKCRVILPAN